MNDIFVRFSLTPDVLADVRLFRQHTWPILALAVIAVVLCAGEVVFASIAAIRTNAAHLSASIDLKVTLCAALCLAVIVLVNLRPALRARHLPTRGELTFSDRGISGMVDGRDVSLAWRYVARVDRVGRLITIKSRDSRTIAIPESSVPDLRAFWKLVDEHILLRRGLAQSALQAT